MDGLLLCEDWAGRTSPMTGWSAASLPAPPRRQVRLQTHQILGPLLSYLYGHTSDKNVAGLLPTGRPLVRLENLTQESKWARTRASASLQEELARADIKLRTTAEGSTYEGFTVFQNDADQPAFRRHLRDTGIRRHGSSHLQATDPGYVRTIGGLRSTAKMSCKPSREIWQTLLHLIHIELALQAER